MAESITAQSLKDDILLECWGVFDLQRGQVWPDIANRKIRIDGSKNNGGKGVGTEIF